MFVRWCDSILLWWGATTISYLNFPNWIHYSILIVLPFIAKFISICFTSCRGMPFCRDLLQCEKLYMASHYYITFFEILWLIKLGNSWNYMPPILVPSSTKRIATQILVILKLYERRFYFQKFSLWYSSLQETTCPNFSNWSTRIRCENCSRLRVH